MPRSVLASAALLSHRQHLKTTSCKLVLGLGLLKKKKSDGGTRKGCNRRLWPEHHLPPQCLRRGCRGVPRESLPPLAAKPAPQPLRPSALRGTQYVPWLNAMWKFGNPAGRQAGCISRPDPSHARNCNQYRGHQFSRQYIIVMAGSWHALARSRLLLYMITIYL